MFGYFIAKLIKIIEVIKRLSETPFKDSKI